MSGMSYTNAGVVAPGPGTDKSYRFFLALFNHIMAQYNGHIIAYGGVGNLDPHPEFVNAASGVGLGTLVKRDAATGTITTNGYTAILPNTGANAAYAVTRNVANGNDELQISISAGVYALRYGYNALGAGVPGLLVNEATKLNNGLTVSNGLAMSDGHSIVLSNGGGTAGYVQADHFVVGGTSFPIAGIATAYHNGLAYADGSGNLNFAVPSSPNQFALWNGGNWTTQTVSSQTLTDVALQPTTNCSVSIAPGVYPFYDLTNNIINAQNYTTTQIVNVGAAYLGGMTTGQERYVAVFVSAAGISMSAGAVATAGTASFPNTGIPTGSTLLGYVHLLGTMTTATTLTFANLLTIKPGLATAPSVPNTAGPGTYAAATPFFITAGSGGNGSITSAQSLAALTAGSAGTVNGTAFDPTNRTSAAFYIDPRFIRTAYNSASVTDILAGAVTSNLLESGAIYAGTGGHVGQLVIDPTISGVGAISVYYNGKMQTISAPSYSQTFTGGAAGAYTAYAETNSGSASVWSLVVQTKGLAPSASQLPLFHVWWDGTQFQTGTNAFLDFTPSFPGFRPLVFDQAFASSAQNVGASGGGYNAIVTAPLSTLYTPTALQGSATATYAVIQNATPPTTFLVAPLLGVNGAAAAAVHVNYVYPLTASSTMSRSDVFLFNGKATQTPILAVGATTFQLSSFYTTGTGTPQVQYVNVHGFFHI